MPKTKSRRYCLYGDTVDVVFSYNESLGIFLGDYPDFDESPRKTPCGRRWVNSTKEDCPIADKNYGDCGSCKYYKCETPGDLIGVCEYKNFREDKNL